MDQRALEREIDQLYQLPPGEFTAARNALAKRAGSAAGEIRAIAKPSIAAWAVNQLYWRGRETWDALMAAAQEAQRAHKAVLSGRNADIRSAGKVHEEAVEAALKATLTLLVESGHPSTDATRRAIATTIRALPADVTPGRLTTTLQPGGFEALAGLSVSAAPRKHVKALPKREPAAPRADAKATARARAAAAAAERALREAEHAARREEFERAKSVREERKLADAVEHARSAVERAQAELERAESELRAAERHREETEARARRAEAAVLAARARTKENG